MASDGGADEGNPVGPERPRDPGERGGEASGAKSNGMPLEQSALVQRVRALTEALEGSDISELELTEDGARILIRRQLEAPIIAPSALPRARLSARGTPTRAARPESARQPGGGAAGAQVGIAVIAPLTGVFYASPSPSTPPFVSVGDTVQAGQVVCLVEAMKVFNEIKAEISGTVTAVVAQGGQLVHKGDPLIRIQPI